MKKTAARDDRSTLVLSVGCAVPFSGGVAGVASVAGFGETGGNGDSTTSDSVRMLIGAEAGGNGAFWR